MDAGYFLGYGSLVNRATHGYDTAYRARIRGWRRSWISMPGHGGAVLSAVPAPEAEIEGLLAEVPGRDWTALDHREAGYDRHTVTDGLEHEAPHPVTAAIYAVPPARWAEPGDPAAILLSYLDVVVQGYLREFGADGPARFAATTLGWRETPILDDRAQPRYPRAQPLNRDEAAATDALIADTGARVIGDDGADG